MRPPGVLALGLPCVVLAAASSYAQPIPRASYSGQLGLNFSIHDQGVAHLMSERFELRLALDIERSGAATLRVRGSSVTEHVDIMPGGRRSPPSTTAVDQTWTGRVTSVGGEARLHLERPTAPGSVPAAQDFRCRQDRASFGTVVLRYWRCEPMTTYAGMPWSDPIAPYLRVPLVFAPGAGVRADGSWSHGSAASLEVSAPRR